MDRSKRILILSKIVTLAHAGAISVRVVAQTADLATVSIIQPLVQAFDDLLAIAQTQNSDIADNYLAIGEIQQRNEELEQQLKDCRDSSFKAHQLVLELRKQIQELESAAQQRL